MSKVVTPFHLLSVDVEDWPQSTLDHSLPIGMRVVDNTKRLLDLMGETRVRATFFVLGKVAEAHPTLAPEIVRAGHEVGTHGYSHESIESLPVGKFKEELHRSLDLLRQQTGQSILGHRAADFSVSSRSLHLFDIMAAEGLAYDSSIVPVRHPRYGIPGAWRFPHNVLCASGQQLLEFPIATVRFGPLVVPASGGGYLRLFPYRWSSMALRRVEQEGWPATCYVHPYEVDVTEKNEIEYAVPFLTRWIQFANRRTVSGKLRRLFSQFRFMTMAEAYEGLRKKPLPGIDLRRISFNQPYGSEAWAGSKPRETGFFFSSLFSVLVQEYLCQL